MKLDPSRQTPHAPSSSGPSPTAPSDAQATKGKDTAPGPTGGRSSGYNWGDDPRDFRDLDWSDEEVGEDERDLSWATVLKRTFESYLRGERPNMYGEWLNWEEEY